MIKITLNQREKFLLAMSVILGASLGIILGRIVIGGNQGNGNLLDLNVPDIICSIIGVFLGIFWFFIRKRIVDKQL